MKKKITKQSRNISYKGYEIPMGMTTNDANQRKLIIKNFYQNWFGENTEKKISNDYLKQYIYVDHNSMKETINWACLSFGSTLTVLELSYVLKHAVTVQQDNPKDNKKQSRFVKMLIMECVVPKLRPHILTAKLIVGVRKRDNKKIQYCLTAK